jgi:hypothetical protein
MTWTETAVQPRACVLVAAIDAQAAAMAAVIAAIVATTASASDGGSS